MAKVLVTGGAGFIGSHLAEALVMRGDKVRVIDNFSTGDRINLAHIEDQVEVQTGDVTNVSDLEKAIHSCEIIFHEAAMVSVPESIESPEKCFDVNVQAVINLLRLAHQQKIKKIVLASSTAVYGAQETMPLHEGMAPQTLSPYAAAKHFNESLGSVYSENYAMQVISLRYFNVYGPRQRPDSDYSAVIPNFIDRINRGMAPIVFGNGLQTRDFIHVNDVVRANILAAENEGSSGETFNICSGIETSLLDLLNLLYADFPDAPKADFQAARLGDVPRSYGNPKKAEQSLSFRAEFSLKDGLHQLLGETP